MAEVTLRGERPSQPFSKQRGQRNAIFPPSASEMGTPRENSTAGVPFPGHFAAPEERRREMGLGGVPQGLAATFLPMALFFFFSLSRFSSLGKDSRSLSGPRSSSRRQGSVITSVFGVFKRRNNGILCISLQTMESMQWREFNSFSESFYSFLFFPFLDTFLQLFS